MSEATEAVTARCWAEVSGSETSTCSKSCSTQTSSCTSRVRPLGRRRDACVGSRPSGSSRSPTPPSGPSPRAAATTSSPTRSCSPGRTRARRSTGASSRRGAVGRPRRGGRDRVHADLLHARPRQPDARDVRGLRPGAALHAASRRRRGPRPLGSSAALAPGCACGVASAAGLCDRIPANGVLQQTCPSAR